MRPSDGTNIILTWRKTFILKLAEEPLKNVKTGHISYLGLDLSILCRNI